MSDSRTALIVSCQPHQRDQLERWLTADGYAPIVAADFREARRQLEASAPDLLVTDLKLGAYNGLHLVIWSRGRSLKTKSMLIGDPDPVLQREAQREGAAYLTAPLDAQSFLGSVATLFSWYHPARRSQRKRVCLDATVDGVLASVVDLSYEGLRLEVPNAEGFTLPPVLTVKLPSDDTVWRLTRVWLGRPAGPSRGALVCGAALPTTDDETMALWRRMVDAVPDFESIEAHSITG
jgi:CheY-like chemotaxis protein